MTGETWLKWQQERAAALNSPQKTGDEQTGQTRVEEHLVAYACRQPSSMMPMLRLLVEHLHADQGQRDPGRIGRGLHHLAAGEHWWQVAEGLPYLIDRGADLELRDESQKTPLLVALGSVAPISLFASRAARKLIECGADVNATWPGTGKTCLSWAVHVIEMTRLLVSKGAIVTVTANFDAIQANNAPALDSLLGAGADPNMRRGIEEGRTRERVIFDRVVPDHELYPLFFAAVTNPKSVRYHEKKTKWTMKDQYIPVIETLLQKGADPFAKFKILPKLTDDEADEIDHNLLEEVTLLHEVLEHGGIVEPLLLACPDLDLEHRDARGRTLLLAACSSRLDPDYSIEDVYLRTGSFSTPRGDDDQEAIRAKSSKPTPIQLLLQRGACATARDNTQRNALHTLLATVTTRGNALAGYDTLRLLLSHEPSLVHQVDSAGETPFHYVLRRQTNWGSPDFKAVEILLDHGGADPYAPDAQGTSTLHHLARWLATDREDQSDPHKLFKRLVGARLDINARDRAGETPAFAFIRQQSRYRAFSNDEGETERQLAALEMLADAGAGFLVVNNVGENLLHVVAATEEQRRRRGGREEEGEAVMLGAFKWLVKKQGLDPMAEDGKQRTCLDVAAVKGNGAILRYVILLIMGVERGLILSHSACMPGATKG
ncbi:Ankyrin repeat-containing domain protein [Rhypophila sp. PSN 637]